MITYNFAGRLVTCFFFIAAPLAVFAQGCAKDDLGRITCAPPGGTAVNAMNGIVCAPGRCVTDDLGYLKCSSKLGGGVAKDDLGKPVCVGGCISPTKDYCEPEMKK